MKSRDMLASLPTGGKNWAGIVAEAVARRFDLTHSISCTNHTKVVLKKGDRTLVWTTSITPSDRNARQNALTDLRHGLRSTFGIDTRDGTCSELDCPYCRRRIDIKAALANATTRQKLINNVKQFLCSLEGHTHDTD